jgi:phospholipid/cholesterol/gamma-HCH transport system substrate-binding protein
VASVSVGKVKKVEVDPKDNLTVATIQLDNKYAPLSQDAKAIVRQKTLLGETYIELTLGSQDTKKLPEGGQLPQANVQDQVQIDEIFNALDERTRENFRDFQAYQARTIMGDPEDPSDDRARDFSDLIGNLGPFATDAADVTETLGRQRRALGQLVRSTGGVLEALTENESALRGAIVNSNRTFGAIANRDAELRETIQVFPTLLNESRRTLARLEEFSRDTNPLINELRPVAPQLTTTLRATRRLAPDLVNLFGDLDKLIDASEAGLPALRRTLAALRPLMPRLDPFLANLNPVLRFLLYNKNTVSDFFGSWSAIGGILPRRSGDPANRHMLRVLSVITGLTSPSPEALAIYQNRTPNNRGNAYLKPKILGAENIIRRRATFPSWDCNNTGQGEVSATPDRAACIVQDTYPREWGGRAFPQVREDP